MEVEGEFHQVVTFRHTEHIFVSMDCMNSRNIKEFSRKQYFLKGFFFCSVFMFVLSLKTCDQCLLGFCDFFVVLVVQKYLKPVL